MELSVILSDAAVAAPAGVARYGTNLCRALLGAAPVDSVISGYSHRLSPVARRALHERVPELGELKESSLGRTALGAAWDIGVRASDPHGAVLAPSLFAPIRSHHNRPLVVTVHDTVPFTHPHTLTARGVAWHRRQIAAAQRWADNILVPTEAVAAALEHFAPALGRIHVVPGAVDTELLESRVTEPHRSDPATIVFVGTLEPRKGLDLLIRAMASPQLATPALSTVRLVIVGAEGWGAVRARELAIKHGVRPERLHAMGRLHDSDLAVVVSRASVLAMPSMAEGFGLPVLEAMALGTPVVHSLDPALVETSGGAGLGVGLYGDPEAAAERLASALALVLSEATLSAELAERGLRRARDFSWTSSAHRVWTLLSS